MNNFQTMLSSYQMNTKTEKINAIHEVMQQVTLLGLYRGGFFERAAFYGGTCLRIFHGLDRFSEDLDFSLLLPDPDFSIEPYLPAIVHEFASLGQQVEIKVKKKSAQTAIQSAFLKSKTAQYNIHLGHTSTIKVKIELDTAPPLDFKTEERLLLQPISFYTRCFSLPDLFAGKMHALLFRAWKNRVKGRDWYDLEWYVRNGIPLNLAHFRARAQMTHLTPDDIRQLMQDKIRQVSIEELKKDIAPFLHDAQALQIWSKEYFLEIAKKLTFNE